MIHNSNVKTPNRDARTGRRLYESRLRTEQSQATRERILEALIRTMAKGVATLSVPDVAREAQVSIPTVYRHFGTKAGLIAALGPYVGTKAGLMPADLPHTVDEIGDAVLEVFRHLEAMDGTLRAAMASELGQEARQAAMPARRATHREVMRRSAPEVTDADLERLTDLSVALMSSGAYRVYRDFIGLSVEDAADRAAWALQTLVRGARAGSRSPS
ncbi:MAG TPA: TetR/AcrR family transcriptional regulator [Candidatus Limnocylindrales bacterium]|nr:TetR/AcrR family transcriptional regulator [Candidatus Limnocylindrales bacterium]